MDDRPEPEQKRYTRPKTAIAAITFLFCVPLYIQEAKRHSGRQTLAIEIQLMKSIICQSVYTEWCQYGHFFLPLPTTSRLRRVTVPSS